MNLLQNLKIKKNISVTLNTENIDKNKIIKTIYYDHPVFKYNKDYVQKQNDITSGENSVFFAGAWLGNGFHEDGVNSAINVFRKISWIIKFAILTYIIIDKSHSKIIFHIIF